MDIRTHAFSAFDDQRPGTSGLRKSVAHFTRRHYTESFFQTILCTLGASGKTIVVGGDGRYHNDHAIDILIRMAVAQGVRRLIVAENGLLSTPAASHIIRKYRADYGIILSASHNPGGPHGDFGIKCNLDAGQPAPESVTEALFATSKTLSEYRIAVCDVPPLVPGCYRIGATTLDVIDSTRDYAELMETLFDFAAIRAWLAAHPIFFDALHAVTGPYAQAIFHERLGLAQRYLLNCVPRADFGGAHPDPEPAQMHDLNDALKAHPEVVMGCASDGDGDRNLIIGRTGFVSPCDSLAIIADHHARIPCLQSLRGIGRSMPTSRAIDTVAAAKGLICYETPTGWKFFANLLDADKIQLCGEESFGTGGAHVREKDGIWAILCWLNLLAASGKSPDEIRQHHWNTYGRHHFNRFDFSGLEKTRAEEMLNNFAASLKQRIGQTIQGLTITTAGQFHYRDPTNAEKSPGQGLQICFGRQARIICRLSGTDAHGTTLRLYCEYWQQPDAPEAALSGTTYTLASLAQGMMDLNGNCGRTQPDNIV